MSFAHILARMKLTQQNAEVIFDRDEPIGTATDLIFKRRERREGGSAPQLGARVTTMEAARHRAAGSNS